MRNMAASSKRIGSETKMMCAAGPAGMSAGPSGPSPEWNGCTTSTPSAFVAGTRAHGRPVKRDLYVVHRIGSSPRRSLSSAPGETLMGYSTTFDSLLSNSRFVALMWRWGCMACPPATARCSAQSRFSPRWARKPRASARGLAREDGERRSPAKLRETGDSPLNERAGPPREARLRLSARSRRSKWARQQLPVCRQMTTEIMTHDENGLGAAAGA